MPIKLKNIPIYFCTCFLVISCSEQLDLKPVQQIDEATALDNDANIKRVLMGAYANLRKESLWGGRTLLYSEILAANNEIRWEGTFSQPREMQNKSVLTNNSFVTETWITAYSTINIANNILSAMDSVKPEDQDRIRGEALFIRGVVYFELVKLFGLPYASGNIATNPATPLILTPTKGDGTNSLVERSSVAEVYQQIIKDLTTAEQLLPETNEFFASAYVASAMLSRVYLQMEDFASARDAANRSIDLATSFGKRLLTNYMTAFNNEENSPEDLFTIQVNPQDPANSMHLFYSTPEFGGRDGDVTILGKHLDLYEPGDERLIQFKERAGGIRTNKWRDQYMNVKIIRLAEMYLTRAEANFREQTNIGATPLEDINRIRARVSLPAKVNISLDEILKERKLELAHEGHILHDIKRTKGLIADNNSEVQYFYTDDRLVFPIPQREITANLKLVQNPGYLD